MKRSHVTILTLVLVVSLALAACTTGVTTRTVKGSGNLKTEDRPVGSFDRVTLAGLGNVVVQLGEKEALTIEAEDNLLPEITSEVRGNELVLGTVTGVNLQPQKTIQYTVTVKSLSAVTLSGSGNIALPSLQAGALTVKISGSGSISGKGTADSLDVQLPGSGQVNMGDLQARTVQVSLPGSGTVTVWATETLDARIPGSGTIQYYGSPRVTENIQGSGSVNGLGNK